MRDAIAAAARVGDIVELRADCLVDPHAAVSFLHESARAIERPLIVTMRSPEQGGRAEIDFETRRGFWSALDHVNAGYFIDLELDLVQDFASLESAELPVDWSRVICSHHDFTRVPDDLEKIFELMAATPAGIIKIALQTDDALDCLSIFKLLERSQAEKRELIAIGMGDTGVMTRILGPSRGSFLTYASLEEESGTAPGQLTAKDLREVYRIDNIDPDTQVFGIMGQPVGHSLSPRIHNAAFAVSSLNAVFLPFEVRDAVQFIRRIVLCEHRLALKI